MEDPFARGAVDAVTLAHGTSWKRIELGFVEVGDRLALGEARVESRASGKDSLLGPADAVSAVSLAFQDLQGVLRHRGTPWDGRSAACERSDGTIRLTLAGAAPAMALEVSDSGLLFGDDFLATLEALGPTAADRQGRLDGALGIYSSKSWDRIGDPGHLVFTLADGKTLRCRTDVIGSHSPAEGTWCWAWANRGLAPELVAAAHGLREASPPLAVLSTAGFRCPGAIGWMVASIAADRMGGRATFGFDIPRSGTILFFAVEVPH